MVATKACTAEREDGGACKATPLRDEPFCLWHSPNHVESVSEGRKLGGQRRRKESVLAAAFDFEGLDSIRLAGRKEEGSGGKRRATDH